MRPKPKEVVGFHFQEINLEEAQNLVIAGDGNYADIKAMLLEKLPALAGDKALAFGLPNGKEVPEDQRRGITMALNMALRKGGINWRVTYSGTRKVFLCIPSQRKAKGVVTLSRPGRKVVLSKHQLDDELDNLKKIEKTVCDKFNVDSTKLKGVLSDRSISRIRRAIVYVAARRFEINWKTINHYYQVRQAAFYGINGEVKTDPELLQKVEDLF